MAFVLGVAVWQLEATATPMMTVYLLTFAPTECVLHAAAFQLKECVLFMKTVCQASAPMASVMDLVVDLMEMDA